MPFMTRVPSDLARFGLKVELVPGWETRGSSSFAPAAVVDHWTAGPRGTTKRPSLNVVTYGRSDLPGPLCNIYLARDGTCVVVAAGRANHAGTGGWRGLVGNSAAYGIEAESAGDGDWTPQMLDAYPRLNAALLSGLGRGSEWLCGHHEWAPGRKIDIRDVIGRIRTNTARHLSGGAPPPAAPIGDDDMDAWNAAVLAETNKLTKDLHAMMGAFKGGGEAGVFRPFFVAAAAEALKGGSVDVKRLAAELAPLVVQSTRSLSQADLDAIGRAVADENARRLAS